MTIVQRMLRAHRSRRAGDIFLAIAALVVLAAPPRGAARDPFDARLRQAEAALQAGELDRAEALYQELTLVFPQRIEPYRGLARTLAARGRPAEAVELLLDAGRELLRAVRAGDAVAPLELAAELAAGQPRELQAETLALLGRVLAEERRPRDAIRALERALELGDRGLWTFLALGESYEETGRHREAEDVYRRCLERFGEAFPALRQAGRYRLERGRAAEALPLLERAAGARPGDVDGLELLARARHATGDRDGAIEAYRRVLELAPGHPRAGHVLRLLEARRPERTPAASPPSAPAKGARSRAVPAEVFLTDIAAQAGIRFRHDPGVSPERHLPETMGSGLAWIDFDGDGWQDLYLVQSGPFPPDGSPAAANRLYRNLGGLRFEDRTAAARAGDRCYGQGALAADFDGDGDLDLYLTCFGPDVLLDNLGDGTFRDRTAERGLGADGWKTAAAAADADGDGDLDLYVARYVGYGPQRGRFCGRQESGEADYCNVNFFAGDDDLLYLQDASGRFREVTSEAGIREPAGRGLGVLWTDLDGDRRPDLYVANDLELNRLYRNLGGGTFEDVSLLSGAAFSRDGHAQASMGVDAADLDGDGLPEILLTHFDGETNTLYRNLGGLQFEDVSTASGFGLPSFELLGFGLAVADYDLDGHLDAYVANGHVFVDPGRQGVTRPQRDLLLLGDGAGRFAEHPLPAARRAGRGAAACDVDRDGDPDVAVQNNGGEPFLLRNDSTAGGSWLGVELRGRARNTRAIGARITLRTDRRRLVRSVRAGGSYLSSADRRLLFAWEAGEDALSLEVEWPAGGRRMLKNPPSGRTLRLAEP